MLTLSTLALTAALAQAPTTAPPPPFVYLPPRAAPPPPPPPPPRKIGSRARRIAGTITPEDYPAEALRQEQSGLVHVRLQIGQDGLVKTCTVIASSGHAILDQATCALMQERWRFTPARDAKGRLQVDTISQRLAWRLPEPEPVLPAPPPPGQ